MFIKARRECWTAVTVGTWAVLALGAALAMIGDTGCCYALAVLGPMFFGIGALGAVCAIEHRRRGS